MPLRPDQCTANHDEITVRREGDDAWFADFAKRAGAQYPVQSDLDGAHRAGSWSILSIMERWCLPSLRKARHEERRRTTELSNSIACPTQRALYAGSGYRVRVRRRASGDVSRTRAAASEGATSGESELPVRSQSGRELWECGSDSAMYGLLKILIMMFNSSYVVQEII